MKSQTCVHTNTHTQVIRIWIGNSKFKDFLKCCYMLYPNKYNFLSFFLHFVLNKHFTHRTNKIKSSSSTDIQNFNMLYIQKYFITNKWKFNFFLWRTSSIKIFLSFNLQFNQISLINSFQYVFNSSVSKLYKIRT